MPFIKRPEGFSSETIELLDRAMMRMYLDHLAARQRSAAVPLNYVSNDRVKPTVRLPRR